MWWPFDEWPCATEVCSIARPPCIAHVCSCIGSTIQVASQTANTLARLLKNQLRRTVRIYGREHPGKGHHGYARVSFKK